jgi:hypothetical protein
MFSFFKIKYKLSLGRKQLTTYDEKNINQIEPEKLRHSTKLYTRPKIVDDSSIIEYENQWEILCNWLPLKQRMQSLHRIYFTSKDGFSLLNLYSKCKDVGPMLILINAFQRNDKFSENDSKQEVIEIESKKVKSTTPANSIFGVFCGESIENSNQMEGTADTFVFSLKPNANAFKWTKKNDYFILGKENEIQFGVGNDGSALRIDDQLQYGNSFPCQTFDNESLCGNYNNFEILRLEVYILK